MAHDEGFEKVRNAFFEGGGIGRQSHAMWIFALNRFELVLFIISAIVLAICTLLLLEIAGIELIDLL